MKTFITLKKENERELPKRFKDFEIRMPECLVRYFLRLFSKEGDKIFDMFAGFVTTQFTAE